MRDQPLHFPVHTGGDANKRFIQQTLHSSLGRHTWRWAPPEGWEPLFDLKLQSDTLETQRVAAPKRQRFVAPFFFRKNLQRLPTILLSHYLCDLLGTTNKKNRLALNDAWITLKLDAITNGNCQKSNNKITTQYFERPPFGNFGAQSLGLLLLGPRGRAPLNCYKNMENPALSFAKCCC